MTTEITKKLDAKLIVNLPENIRLGDPVTSRMIKNPVDSVFKDIGVRSKQTPEEHEEMKNEDVQNVYIQGILRTLIEVASSFDTPVTQAVIRPLERIDGESSFFHVRPPQLCNDNNVVLILQFRIERA